MVPCDHCVPGHRKCYAAEIGPSSVAVLEVVDGMMQVCLSQGDETREQALREMSPAEPLPLILTHQTNSPIEGAYNVGGFTDGDRALCLMLALGIQPERLVLVGYDEQTFGRWSGVSNEALKRRKLAWMAKILDKVGFGNG